MSIITSEDVGPVGAPVPCLQPGPRIALTLVEVTPGGPVGLSADVILSALANNGLVLADDGLWSPGYPPIVTDLPTSPVDEQEVYYRYTGGDHDVLWHLTFVEDDNLWRYVGGSPGHARQETLSNISTGSSWVDAPTAGPSLSNVPQGQYLARFGALLNGRDNPTFSAGLSLLGSDPAANAVITQNDTNPISVAGEFYIGMPSHGVVKMMFLNNSGGTCSADHRFISITPVQISPV